MTSPDHPFEPTRPEVELADAIDGDTDIAPKGPQRSVHLGLGANVGDALETVTAAIYALDDIDGIAVREVSGVYRTAAWPQPPDPRAVAQDDYLNAVVAVDCTLDPADLLTQVQTIERLFGRDRASEQRWGPRPLDIDVLLDADATYHLETPVGPLTVPHPRLTQRAFVLVPLMEILPGGALPDGRRLSTVMRELGVIDGITLEVRLEGMPGNRLARPTGPAAPAATFERPADASWTRS